MSYSTKTTVNYKSLDFLGHPDYRVGDDGSVWSRKRGDWKPLKQITQPNGYRAINICHTDLPNGFYPFHVHRLVLSAFVSECPEGMEACHNDGDKGNNSLTNLRWDTRKNNHKDKIEHGTHLFGEKHGRTKFTDEDVLTIRRRHREGDSQTEMAKEYKVSVPTINSIIRRRNWKHLP